MSQPQTFKPSEGKREEFRKYLEKNGIMDALTKVLVNLYEEVDKPENALQYIIDKLSIQAGLETHKQLMTQLDETNQRIQSLEEEVETLKAQQEPMTMTEERPSSQVEVGEAPPLEGEEGLAPEPAHSSTEPARTSSGPTRTASGPARTASGPANQL